MAVSSIKLVATSGSITADGHIDLTATYDVYTTDADSDLAWTVLSAVDAYIPDYWVVGNDNLTVAVPHQIGEAVLTDEHKKWRVPVRYSTKPLPGGAGAGFGPKNPYGTGGTTILDEPWRISGTYVGTTKATSTNRFGATIRLAGTEELKELEVPDGYDTLRLEGATADISLPSRAQAMFKCNSVTMWGLTPRQLFLAQWVYEERFYAGVPYIWNSLEFWIKYTEWTERFWNASRKQINPDYVAATMSPEEFLIPILDAAGLPVTTPHRLDAAGVACEIADTYLNEQEVIDEFNFLTLGFPATLPGPFV